MGGGGLEVLAGGCAEGDNNQYSHILNQPINT